MRKILAALVFQLILIAPAFSQHHEHMSPTGDSVETQPSMRGVILFRVPMSMEGSGTSWQPEASPMHMAMYPLDEWNLMLHGAAFLRYTRQGGLRGESALSSPNWFMTSAQRMLGENSQIMFRAMLSLDRVTEGGDGYPLLLQSGAAYRPSTSA